MTTISTLSEFLLQAGTEYRVYDMGRGIRYLPDQLFLDIENGAIPYPYPRQSHAWIGILFWNKNLSHEHYIWFLKLPVDEFSHLISGPRDHFLNLVVEALANTSSNQSDTLSKVENPYNFTPNQQALADFNALTKSQLQLPPSNFYQETKSYLSAPKVINWQTLALQGIADFCANMTEGDNEKTLINAIKSLPAPVQNAFFASFEHYSLPIDLVEVLLELANENKKDINTQALVVRSLAQSQQYQVVKEYILGLLNRNDSKDINLLSVVVGRHWQLLDKTETVTSLLESAVAVSPDVCTGLYQDLVGIPEMRKLMLEVLRKSSSSALLDTCFKQLRKELST
ncbi:DUF3549 family protein [Alteromonadaceae bacterium M269]|nr:DUF3549 family protein [Alteromonadaceae bacterium M269]